jgi:hypothetical protein
MFQKIYTILNGKGTLLNSWNFLIFFERGLISEDIFIPVEKTLVMHSPKIDCDIILDGELYIE